MARATISAALGELGNISTFVGQTSLQMIGANSTTLSLQDADGDGFTLSGMGLTYSASGVTGGTFTGLLIYSDGGVALETVTDFSTDAKGFYDLYKFGGIAAGVLDLFKGDDLLTGSNIGDKLAGFSGNDTIKGGGGNDLIAGSVGRDKLSGQGGSDTFLFVAGDGKDTITDFTDTGGRSDDRIGLTQRMYNTMSLEETATGVTVHFAHRDAIMVNGWHTADVDITDFMIG